MAWSESPGGEPGCDYVEGAWAGDDAVCDQPGAWKESGGAAGGEAAGVEGGDLRVGSIGFVKPTHRGEASIREHGIRDLLPWDDEFSNLALKTAARQEEGYGDELLYRSSSSTTALLFQEGTRGSR